VKNGKKYINQEEANASRRSYHHVRQNRLEDKKDGNLSCMQILIKKKKTVTI
jgi:hypothetical protein